jgi:hypothetical protein
VLLIVGVVEKSRHAANGCAESQYPHKRYLCKWILQLRPCVALRKMTEKKYFDKPLWLPQQPFSHQEHA